MKNLSLKNFYIFTRALLTTTPTRSFTSTVVIRSMVPLFVSNTQISPNAIEDRNSSHENTPVIFKNKYKKARYENLTKQNLVVNYAGKIRHQPPAVKE